MWKIFAALLCLIVGIVCGIAVLPYAVSEMVADALRQQTAAEDVQVSIIDSPRLIFGEIGAIDGVVRQGRIGKIFVRELTMTGTGIRFEPLTLLREQKVVVTEAKSIELHGIIDADAIRELITKSSSKFEDVAVTVTPGNVLATAKTRAFGQTFEVEIDGAFTIVSGDLYYKVRSISARGKGMNALRLDALFEDVIVARADALPFGLVFQNVEARDSVVTLTARK